MKSEDILTLPEIEANWNSLKPSPSDSGRLELIVCRPALDARKLLERGRLDPRYGLVGDNWSKLGHSPNPGRQVTLMNARVVSMLSRTSARWPLAGDQLFVDLDLSLANLPPGSRLQVGEAVVEISSIPHTGCAKFASRFGQAALDFINAPERKDLRLRGVNGSVVQPGTILPGDPVEVLSRPA